MPSSSLFVRARAVFACVLALGCGGEDADAAKPARCEVTAPVECTTPAPHYDDVAPLLAKSCVPCHDGTSGGPWPLTDYEDVADWWDAIRDELLRCSMPPVDAEVPLSRSEREALLLWIRCGVRR